MASTPKLSQAELEVAVSALSGWTLDGGKLYKEFRFSDFVHAFGFMSMAALRIEAMNHHPEWFNVYHTVKVHLTTHDAGGITETDLKLAGILDEVAAKLQ